MVASLLFHGGIFLSLHALKGATGTTNPALTASKWGALNVLLVDSIDVSAHQEPLILSAENAPAVLPTTNKLGGERPSGFRFPPLIQEILEDEERELLSYLPAKDLDVRPKIDSLVLVPYPDSALGKPNGEVVLVLYVSENGVVERVRVDRSDVPPQFEAAAIETFLSAQVSPGEKAGVASKARFKVLVEFQEKKR